MHTADHSVLPDSGREIVEISVPLVNICNIIYDKPNWEYHID